MRQETWFKVVSHPSLGRLTWSKSRWAFRLAAPHALWEVPNKGKVPTPPQHGKRKWRANCLGAETPVWQGARIAHTPDEQRRHTGWIDAQTGEEVIFPLVLSHRFLLKLPLRQVL